MQEFSHSVRIYSIESVEELRIKTADCETAWSEYRIFSVRFCEPVWYWRIGYLLFFVGSLPKLHLADLLPWLDLLQVTWLTACLIDCLQEVDLASVFGSQSSNTWTVVQLDAIAQNNPLRNGDHVAVEMHDILRSYYKLARKRFVHYVRMQVADYAGQWPQQAPQNCVHDSVQSNQTKWHLVICIHWKYSCFSRSSPSVTQVSFLPSPQLPDHWP